ncbi:ATP-dependent rRNA helicase SPB4 [Myxozyma melibiosi]|uniref:ATP-dependent RNA helicase n=1 Tax=Myxozyma melibiosi TaxID=54550 RepID=A0ABR1F9L4_9ASCO
MASRDWNQLSPRLTSWVADAVQSMGYAKMTPVQASVIPLFCGNKDVVVEAVTGSGKTIAFAIPIIERLLNTSLVSRGRIGAMVIAPTRELATQIYKVINSILAFQGGEEGAEDESKPTKRLRSQLLIGGASNVNADVETFLDNNSHIVVGTPGRLLEFIKSPKVQVSNLEVLVLDEADRLLELGFGQTLDGIIRRLPKQRRTGLFSATVSDAVGELARAGLRNPVKVVVKTGNGSGEQKVPTTLHVSYTVLTPEDKLPALIEYLNTLTYKKTIVYFATCASVVYFYSALSNLKSSVISDELSIFSLHGKLPQGPRTKTLNNFISSSSRSVLLTTDVAARGLDIPEVDIVIQFDAPYEANMFLHRAGRAARAGRYGEGYLMLSEGREEDYIELLRVKKVKISEAERPSLEKKRAKFYKLLRKWMLEDRERHDQAVKAYVSYVRFYTKHTMTSIFRMSEFDFLGYARAYGLLRLPSMPELKTLEGLPEGGWLEKDFDMSAYTYKDSKREEQRQIEIKEKEAKTAAAKAKSESKSKAKEKPSLPNTPWSAKAERQEKREERHSKKQKRAIAVAQVKVGEESSSDEEMEDDWKKMVSERKAKKQKTVPVFDL